jgi:hypothetical protein
MPDTPDRFVLRVGTSTLETPVIESIRDVHVYMQGKQLHVESNEVIDQIIVANVQGIRVLDKTPVNNRSAVSGLNVPAGVYIVSVRLANGETVIEKIVTK